MKVLGEALCDQKLLEKSKPIQLFNVQDCVKATMPTLPRINTDGSHFGEGVARVRRGFLQSGG